MRYHYPIETGKDPQGTKHGVIYYCDHPVYNRCTLYKIGDHGLAVIQQIHLDGKATAWDCIQDDQLADDIYFDHGFHTYFMENSGLPENGLYPTVSVRHLMWALRMKPLPKGRWETVFDRRFI